MAVKIVGQISVLIAFMLTTKYTLLVMPTNNNARSWKVMHFMSSTRLAKRENIKVFTLFL
jgi:flagellar biogenesis protein FliO